MDGPQILTTVVGSYPIPSWLAAYPSQEALRDATMAVLKIQELAGIDVVADGELYRFDINHPDTNGMIEYFIGQMDGVSTRVSRAQLARFRERRGVAYRSEPAGVVTGPIGEGSLNLGRDYRRVRALTRSRLKFTLTGPHMLAKVVENEYYPGAADLAMAIADVLRAQVEEIDADVVQIDEANITGHPEEGEWAAEAINRVLAGVRGEKAVHLCFGNYGGQRIQKGHWQGLVDFINRLQVDHMVLELAGRDEEELAALKDIRPEIGLGIGVIDIKRTQIETPSEVARRIERAVATLGEGRVRYVHPDCGFWMLPRSVADGKMAALVKGRNAFLGLAQ